MKIKVNVVMYLNTQLTLNILLGCLIIALTAYFLMNAPSSAFSQLGTDLSSQNLSNNTGNSTDAAIALYQNNVYLVWTDDTTGNQDIYFKRSVDNGTSFGETVNLSRNNTGSSTGAQISAIGNNVYVVWQDTGSGSNEINYRHSNNSGVEFGGVMELSKTRAVNGESAVYPRISANGQNVYVVWQDTVSGSNEIFLRGSTDGGNKFSGIKNLSRNNTGDSISPRIASSGSNVFVVWTDSEPKKSQIFARTSADYAGKFGGIKNVSWSSGSSYDPQVAVGGNDSIYVLWEDTSFRKSTFDLILRASFDKIRTFQDKVNLGRYVGEISDYGQIAARGNGVFVVWSDSPEYGYPPVYKVFLAASRDNAISFDDAISLSSGEGRSINPQVAVSTNDNSIFVIWTEITNSNSDIHFVKLVDIL